jgi:hypothetical protein
LTKLYKIVEIVNTNSFLDKTPIRVDSPILVLDYGELDSTLPREAVREFLDRTEAVLRNAEAQARLERNAKFVAIVLADERERINYTRPILDALDSKF